MEGRCTIFLKVTTHIVQIKIVAVFKTTTTTTITIKHGKRTEELMLLNCGVGEDS